MRKTKDTGRVGSGAGAQEHEKWRQGEGHGLGEEAGVPGRATNHLPLTQQFQTKPRHKLTVLVWRSGRLRGSHKAGLKL